MILRQRILQPDNSLPDNSSFKKTFPGGGKFFARAFFARMILRQRILQPDNSLPDNSSFKKTFPGGGKFFARAFRIILR
jgi:hypothetical protein